MLNRREITFLSFFIASFTFTEAASFSDGYILYAAIEGSKTTLVDNNNTIVHTWTHKTKSGYSVYLLESGNILRTAMVETNAEYPPAAFPLQGIIEEVDKSGTTVWSYTLSNDTYITHHDMKYMPNGHILACAFEQKNKEELIEAGMDTAILKTGMMGMGGAGKTLLAEMIFELDPRADGGPKIVWEWHIWDHIVPKAQAAAHPELFSTAITPQLFMGQWVHLNGLDYCAKTDLILFTSRVFSELYVLDHSTTTQQAATHTGGNHGKGGDLLYRWGRPANYQGSGDTTVYVLHCPTWIPDGYPGAGDILFFHNNTNSSMTSRGQSQAIEVKPPLDANGKFICTAGKPFGPEMPIWKYEPKDGMQSIYMSSAFRMKNGNTLIHESQSSTVREVTPDQQVVWKDTLTSEKSTGGMISMMLSGPAKIMYYPSDYIGLARLLNLPIKMNNPQSASHRTTGSFTVRNVSSRAIEISNAAGSHIDLYTIPGRKVSSLQINTDRAILPTARFPAGTCIVRATFSGKEEKIRIVNIAR